MPRRSWWRVAQFDTLRLRLVARGLLALDTTRPTRLLFTEAGLAALREMMADKRLADPTKFRHVRQELGLESGDGVVSTQVERR